MKWVWVIFHVIIKNKRCQDKPELTMNGIFLQIYVKEIYYYICYLKKSLSLCGIYILIKPVFFFLLSFQDMEENFKQVSLQDKQDQTILEKRHTTKVFIFTVVFCFKFSYYVCTFQITVLLWKWSYLRVLVFWCLKVYIRRK